MIEVNIEPYVFNIDTFTSSDEYTKRIEELRSWYKDNNIECIDRAPYDHYIRFREVEDALAFKLKFGL